MRRGIPRPERPKFDGFDRINKSFKWMSAGWKIVFRGYDPEREICWYSDLKYEEKGPVGDFGRVWMWTDD